MPTITRARKKGKSIDGRQIVRSDSRKEAYTTQFTTRGDGAAIGDGSPLEWDFSNTDDDISAPTGFKRKRLDMSFHDGVQIKEGTTYYHNKSKGSYVDFYVICPDGQYYYDRNGTPQQASGDVVINHYVNTQYIQGSVPMGDELNTEGANENDIPSNYLLRLEVTVPDTDSTSNGWVLMEIYRSRTKLLPGESV